MTRRRVEGLVDTIDFYRRWLVAVGLLLTGFGLLMALISGTSWFDPLRDLVTPAFWPHAPTDAATVGFEAWAFGVWGATIAGWGVTVTFLAQLGIGRREPWAWHALAIGTVLWFVLDTGVSLVHGVMANVAINAVILVLVAVPLGATRSQFR